LGKRDKKMITVIYCTREEYPSHTDFIKKTSGIKDIEVIEYINKGEPLTKFYNKGLKEASNDIIVFCHDDIVFNTKKWGRKLINHFENTDYGILGVAGTTDMSESGRWWDDPSKMLGQVRHSHEGKSWDSKYCSNFGDKVIESIIVDGLFFAVDRTRLKTHFNEEFKGFHFYEVDFCFGNHLAGVKVGVMSDIRLTHKSIGMTNEEWEKNRLQFAEKYKDTLPYKLESEIFYNEKVKGLVDTPHVGVIIPTKGNIELLTKCVDSLWEKDDYPSMTVYIADTGSTPEEIEEIKLLITKHSIMSDRPRTIKLIEYDYYNFAKINNDVVWNHVDDYVELLLFCNNDIELINNAITRMVPIAYKKGIGTVGARLYYEDRTLQHSGIVAFIGQDRRIRISHKGLGSYYNYHPINTNVFGNTAAFMMMRKDMFDKIGGFNQGYLECFEDVELNIDCLTRNLKNVFVPDAVCYHYESQTRKDDPDKLKREGEDYTKRLMPIVITSKRCHNYFDNISAKDLEGLIGQTMKRLV
jgi:GT2 family glycosyltransferase